MGGDADKKKYLSLALVSALNLSSRSTASRWFNFTAACSAVVLSLQKIWLQQYYCDGVWQVSKAHVSFASTSAPCNSSSSIISVCFASGTMATCSGARFCLQQMSRSMHFGPYHSLVARVDVRALHQQQAHTLGTILGCGKKQA